MSASRSQTFTTRHRSRAGSSRLLRRRQTAEPAHAFLFFGSHRQLVGRFARWRPVPPAPRAGDRFRRTAATHAPRARWRDRQSGCEAWLSAVVSWAPGALQSTAFRRRFPARFRSVVHYHPFVRQEPFRRPLFGALRARKPALPDRSPALCRPTDRPTGRPYSIAIQSAISESDSALARRAFLRFAQSGFTDCPRTRWASFERDPLPCWSEAGATPAMTPFLWRMPQRPAP